MRVRINRGEPRRKFLDLQHGSCEQVQPNGLTFDGSSPSPDADGSRMGAGAAILPIVPKDWGGNRSGE